MSEDLDQQDEPTATDTTASTDAPEETPLTGVTSVDAAAQRLAELADAPIETHVGIYEDVHHRLQEGLADLDDQ